MQKLTWAASAAFALASLWSRDDASADELPPSVLGGPPTLAGTGAVLGPGGGAEPSTRPGLSKGSASDLPQMFPMAVNSGCGSSE
jgi:hypothetical protein